MTLMPEFKDRLINAAGDQRPRRRRRALAAAGGGAAVTLAVIGTIALNDPPVEREAARPTDAPKPCPLTGALLRGGVLVPPEGTVSTRRLPSGSVQTTRYMPDGGFTTAICGSDGEVKRGQTVTAVRFADGSVLPAVTQTIKRGPDGTLQTVLGTLRSPSPRAKRELKENPPELLAPFGDLTP